MVLSLLFFVVVNSQVNLLIIFYEPVFAPSFQEEQKRKRKHKCPVKESEVIFKHQR